MKHGLRVLLGLVFAAVVMTAGSAFAQTYPSLVVGTAGVVWECNGACTDASAIPPSNPVAMSTFTPGAINYNSNAASNGYTIGGFLDTAGGGAGGTLSGTALYGDNADNTLWQITGKVFIGDGTNTWAITHDDGAQFFIPGLQAAALFSQPGPTSAETTTFSYVNNVNSADGFYTFVLNYNECCGPPAVLQLSQLSAPGPTPGAGLPSFVVLVLAGALAWTRKFA
jgi:hypothetical protein